MPFADAYLEKNHLNHLTSHLASKVTNHHTSEVTSHSFPRGENIPGSKLIPSPPTDDLVQVIVIPCHKEPDLLSCLESLFICIQPPGSVEVIIIINSALGASQEIRDINKSTLEQANEWISSHRHLWISFYPLLYPDFPDKHAGPGLARKTGMDLAVSRFNSLDRPAGIITSLDADTTVDPNYLQAIQELFSHDPGCIGCNVHFEHPLDEDTVSNAVAQNGIHSVNQTGKRTDTESVNKTGKQPTTDIGKQSVNETDNQAVIQAIIQYELHLRYYIQALKHTGFPYAFHTIGSIFSVRAEAYVRQGGMNRRKAGEDFYFLQKLIPLGGFRELHTTTVYPSSRSSDRVPFGTGSFISKFIQDEETNTFTYHFDAFTDLKAFLDIRDSFFRADNSTLSRLFEILPRSIRVFLSEEFYIKIEEINHHTSSLLTFRKRFHAWFNAFKVLKFLNYAHKNHYKKIPVTRAIHLLIKTTGTANIVGTASTSDTKSPTIKQSALHRKGITGTENTSDIKTDLKDLISAGPKELLLFMRELQKRGY